MSERKQQPERKIDTDQVISYLNYSFSKATAHLGSKNQKGTDLYGYQVEFCYLVDEIKRGPKYTIPKLISEANELIEKVASTAPQKVQSK